MVSERVGHRDGGTQGKTAADPLLLGSWVCTEFTWLVSDSGPEPLAAGSASAASISCRSLATLQRAGEGGKRAHAGYGSHASSGLQRMVFWFRAPQVGPCRGLASCDAVGHNSRGVRTLRSPLPARSRVRVASCLPPTSANLLTVCSNPVEFVQLRNYSSELQLLRAFLKMTLSRDRDLMITLSHQKKT